MWKGQVMNPNQEKPNDHNPREDRFGDLQERIVQAFLKGGRWVSDLNRCTIEREKLKVVIEIGDVPMEDVLSAIEDCLKGIGFSFDGQLNVEKEWVMGRIGAFSLHHGRDNRGEIN